MVIVVEDKNKKSVITYIFIIIALIAFIVIGKQNYKQEDIKDNNAPNKYNLLNYENVFEKINASQALKKINNGNTMIFMGFEENKQSEHYASLLNEVAINLKIEKIYYYDFYNDRQENNGTYETIISKLTNYLQKDDEGNIDLQSPTFLVIKEGNVIYFDADTSRLPANLSEEDYWNEYNKSIKKTQLEVALNNYLGV